MIWIRGIAYVGLLLSLLMLNLAVLADVIGAAARNAAALEYSFDIFYSALALAVLCLLIIL
ncbi:MAG: hypothetical protein QXK65_01760 [Candidatus Micrarchaeaceae archaeon]